MSCFDLFSSLPHLIVLPSLFVVMSLLFFFKSSPPSSKNLPRVYPIIGSHFSLLANRERLVDWTADLVRSSPSATYILQLPLGVRRVFTGNPANVQHILKTQFNNYEKGEVFKTTLRDVLGEGIFNTDGESWKFQRQVSSHEFNTRSLRKFVETVVDAELKEWLLPLLASAAKSRSVVDMQDILQSPTTALVLNSSSFSTMSCFDLFSSLPHSIVLPSLFLVISLFFFFFFFKSPPPSSKNLPRVYPIIGSYFSLFANTKQLVVWTADLV